LTSFVKLAISLQRLLSVMTFVVVFIAFGYDGIGEEKGEEDI
jgi:hypothetical protein